MSEGPLGTEHLRIHSVDVSEQGSWRAISESGLEAATVALSRSGPGFHATLIFNEPQKRSTRWGGLDAIVASLEMNALVGTDLRDAFGGYQVVELRELFPPESAADYANQDLKIAYATVRSREPVDARVRELVAELNRWIESEKRPQIVYGYGVEFANADEDLLTLLKSARSGDDETWSLTCTTYILLLLRNSGFGRLFDAETWPVVAQSDVRRLRPSELVSALCWRKGSTVPCRYEQIRDLSLAHERFMRGTIEPTEGS